jgi:hypothetical protein
METISSLHTLRRVFASSVTKYCPSHPADEHQIYNEITFYYLYSALYCLKQKFEACLIIEFFSTVTDHTVNIPYMT